MNWGWSPSSGRSSGASPDGLYEHSSGRIRFWRIHADYSLKEIRKRGEVSMSISHKLNSRAKLLGNTAAAFMLLGAAPAFAQASAATDDQAPPTDMAEAGGGGISATDWKSTRLNSSH